MAAEQPSGDCATSHRSKPSAVFECQGIVTPDRSAFLNGFAVIQPRLESSYPVVVLEPGSRSEGLARFGALSCRMPIHSIATCYDDEYLG